jgi:hypothetical protein
VHVRLLQLEPILGDSPRQGGRLRNGGWRLLRSKGRTLPPAILPSPDRVRNSITWCIAAAANLQICS